MPATIAGSHLGLDIHANRPAANAAGQPIGALYSCSTHGLVYKTDGSTWATWATLGGSLSDQGVITYLDGTVAAAPATPAAGKLRIYAKTGKVLAVKDDAGLETVLGAGGGGVTVQYPPLKPGSPTDDFAAAALNGAWSAHSSGGSFTTGDCLTQGDDWVGSSLRMMFSNQMGALYRTHADADLDVTLGGIRERGYTSAGIMPGIAALNASGTGVGVVAYNDGGMYFVNITAWQEASAIDGPWSFGVPNMTTGAEARDYWMRLKRVAGTWTAYASRSGRVWDKTFATSATAVTVDRIAIGLFFNTAVTYYATLIADYYQEDV